MPVSLARALQINIDNLRWWEWELWAADDAHLTTTVIHEFKSTYRDWKQYQNELNEHMPAPAMRRSDAPQVKRPARRR